MDVPWKTTIYDAKQIYAKKLIENYHKKDDNNTANNKIPTTLEFIWVEDEKNYKLKHFFDKIMPEAIKDGIYISATCMVFPIPIHECKNLSVLSTDKVGFKSMKNIHLLFHIYTVDSFNNCLQTHGLGFPIVNDFFLSGHENQHCDRLYEKLYNIIGYHTYGKHKSTWEHITNAQSSIHQIKDIIESEMIDKWGKDHNELYKKLYLTFWSF